MKRLTLPVWTVVNLDVLVKSGLPSAFVRSNNGVVAFTDKATAEAFIRDSKAEHDYAARPIETSRELAWFLTSLERDQIARVHLNPGQQRQRLCLIAELQAANVVDAEND